MGLNDINGLSHTRWNCKYHIVFAPKYHREGILPRKESSNRKNTAAVMGVERGKDHRSGSVPQPHSSVHRDTTENVSGKLQGQPDGTTADGVLQADQTAL